MGTRAYFYKFKKLPDNWEDIKDINDENGEYSHNNANEFYDEDVGVFLYNYLDTDIFDGHKIPVAIEQEEGSREFFALNTKIARKIFLKFYLKKHVNLLSITGLFLEDLSKLCLYKWLRKWEERRYWFYESTYFIRYLRDFNKFFKAVKKDTYIFFKMT